MQRFWSSCPVPGRENLINVWPNCQKTVEDKTLTPYRNLNMDAKDILGLPKTPLPLPQEKKSRPQKDSQRKPDGISREVLSLSLVDVLQVWEFSLNWWWDFRYTPLQVVWHLSCLQSILLNWSGAFNRRTKRLVILELQHMFHYSYSSLSFLGS